MQRKLCLTVLSVCLFGLMQTTSLAATKDQAEMKHKSLIVLSQARGLEGALIGEGARSTTYDAYGESLKNINSISLEDLHWLEAKGTPGGRIYAALLLLSKDAKAGRTAFVDLLADNKPMNYQTGCEILQATVRDIAKDFVCTGTYLDFKPATTGSIKRTNPIYVEELLNAQNFADRTAGESGPHREYLVFLAAKDSLSHLKAEDLQQVLSKGSPAGRLYAATLIALKKSDKTSFDKLLHDNSKVTYISGCKGFPSTVAEIAQQLKDKGNFFGFAVH